MSEHPLRDIEACLFDAYGTLFDTQSVAERCQQALGADWRAFSDLWRTKQLQYTWLRSLMGRHADFWQVTGEALDFALQAFGRADIALRAQLMQQYLALDAFPDAAAALGALKAKGIRTGILSNGTPTMLAAAVNTSRLTRLLDVTLSVEPAAIFKPHPSVYQHAVDILALPAQRIGFVSSNGWDAHGAAAFGLRSIWVNRAKAPDERLPVHPEATIASLAELPALLGAA